MTDFKKPEIGRLYQSDRARLVIAEYVNYFNIPNDDIVIYYLDGKRDSCHYSQLEYLLNSITPLC